MDIQVDGWPARVRERGVELELTDDARELLGNDGYDPTYGARPLKRAIQKRLVDRWPSSCSTGRVQPGDTVRVTAEDGDLAFVEPTGEPVATSG